ncbi:MAG TPA: hypothetical protein EYP41_11400 [Anaerolineae bacterium]|nr:hypothetical protein [Anaerolineae bacterium]
MKAINFVILTTQRSGSTWLVDVLDGCIDTAVYGELFLPEKMKWQAGSSDFPQFFEARRGMRPLATFAYLNRLYGRPGHIGFKLMYSNLRRYPEILPYLCWRRLPVVHLVRRNVLDVMISAEMAQAKGQWHVTAVDPVPAATRQIWLDPQTLPRRLQRLQKKTAANRRWLRACRLPHLEISYEALLTDPMQFDRIFQFLGLAAGKTRPQSGFAKIRQAGYAAEISNYAEIKETLAGTKFSRLLEEENGVTL